MRQIGVGWSGTTGVLDAAREAALVTETHLLLYLAQLIGNGQDVGQVRVASGGRESIDTFANRGDGRGVANASGLCGIIGALHELLFELRDGRTGLFNKRHEDVAPALGQHLLGQCK